MIYALVICIIIICILIYVTRNLLLKNEVLEDKVETQQEILGGYAIHINSLSNIIDLSDNRLKELDTKGAFKSDDEVGFFFDQLKQMQSIFNEFRVEVIKDEEEK